VCVGRPSEGHTAVYEEHVTLGGQMGAVYFLKCALSKEQVCVYVCVFACVRM